MRAASLALVLTLGLGLSTACGDSTEETETETGADTGWDTDLAPTHNADIQPIWDNACTPCHVGGGTSGGLALDSGYSATVDVPSSVAGMDLVEPGSSNDSYLWHKLSGTQASVGGTGVQMPKDIMLPSRDLRRIKAWIDQGAEK